MASKVLNKTKQVIAIPSTPSKKAAEAALAGALPPDVILLPGENLLVESRDKIPLDVHRQLSLGYIVSAHWDAVKGSTHVKAYVDAGKIAEEA